MKKLTLLTCLTLVLTVSCRHKKEGEVVMDKKGRFYQLREGAGNESYALDLVDTNLFKPIGFDK